MTAARVGTPGLPTRGPHVFVPPLDDDDRFVELRGEPAHHLGRVLRRRPGDAVSLADGSGLVCQAEVAEVDRELVVLRIDARHQIPAPSRRITVLQGLPKGRKMDEVVQRLTEVGVDRLVPLVTARTVKEPGGKHDKLGARWTAIELAAAQQSRRPRRMRIEPIAAWPVADPPPTGVVVWEEATTPMSDALAALGPVAELVLAIGPEGGFEADEVARSGLISCRLGDTILRTETAGLVAATLASQHLGRFA